MTSEPSTRSDDMSWHGHIADDLGSTFGPEPMASLQANAQRLILTGPRGTFELPRASIRKVGHGKMYPWFFRAVRIHHGNPAIPSELQFKPLGLRPAQILDALEQLGYPR